MARAASRSLGAIPPVAFNTGLAALFLADWPLLRIGGREPNLSHRPLVFGVGRVEGSVTV